MMVRLLVSAFADFSMDEGWGRGGGNPSERVPIDEWGGEKWNVS
jgi:hypothetical protein